MTATTIPAAVIAVAFPTPFGVRATGLVVDPDLGRLGPARLWQLPAATTTGPTTGPPPGGTTTGIGGLVVASGRVYATRPDGWITVTECDGSTVLFGAVGPGHPLGLLTDPGGLAVTATHELVVADRGNHRVQSFDRSTGQLVSVWPGLDTPGDVAVGSDGRIHATTAAGVVELTAAGTHRLVASPETLGGRPCSLTTVPGPGTPGADVPDRLIVALTDPAALVAVDPAGTDPVTSVHPAVVTGLTGPWCVRVRSGRLLIGSATDRVVRVAGWFDGNRSRLGSDRAQRLGDVDGGPVAVVALDVGDDGRLWVTDGCRVVGSLGERPVPTGTATIGPIPLRLDPGRPHRLRLRLRGRPDPAAVRLDARWWRGGVALPVPSLTEPEVLAHDKLLAVPTTTDAVTVTVSFELDPTETGDPAGGRTVTDGARSDPWIDLIELRVDEPGLIDHLPELYRTEGDPGSFLDPYLRLAGSGNDDIIEALLELPDQFDPGTATDDLDGDNRWLDWLAGWVDARIDERWTSERRRSVVGGAFAAHGRRGTAAALLERIAVELPHVRVTVTEPADGATVWRLSDGATGLGMTSMLAAAPADGSVLDVTAVADRSHLIGPSDHGAPLFGDWAHRFVVEVQAATLRPGDEERLSAIVERERPAHTHGHVCRLEPGIRLGIDIRVGIDTVVGGPGDGAGFDTGPTSALGGFAADRPGHRHRLGDEPPRPLTLR